MAPADAALRAEGSGQHVSLFRGGESRPRLTQHAYPDRRPYIHPILAPDGAGILTEDAPAHHPWQHGLYAGLNAVNGVGFWKEGGTDGTFHPEPLPPPSVSGSAARWTVATEWRAPGGAPLLTEWQGWTLTDRGDTYTLDVDWRLRAEIDLFFGPYAYGGLFLRMPYRKEAGGTALSSEGKRNADAEARRARWVAVSMPIESRVDEAGIAVMDHPDNPEYPVPWRVDSQLGVAPSRCIAGEWRLPAGESILYRHRFLVFCGSADAARVEESWEDFAGRQNP